MEARARHAVLGVACALPLALWLRGFMVDDALIAARYASHVASGVGYRFNPGGPPTDGVTPLGWALLLAPLGRNGVLAGFAAAKWLGLGCWLAAAAALGVTIGAIHEARGRWLGLLLLASSAPLAAWASSGMETGLVTALVTAAVAGRAWGREGWSAGGAIAAGLRPELIPWAVAMALGPARPEVEGVWRHRWARLGLALGPAALAALVRLVVFGRPLPLALLAKPPSLQHGLMYAAACALLCGFVALVGLRGVPPWSRGLALAAGVHVVAMAFAGGDWMPLSRLAVPVLPAVIVAGSMVAATALPSLGALRGALALAGQLFVVVKVGPAAAAVGAKRMAVIEELGPALAGAMTVAALDIGWVGAATSAHVVDLAGVTDPAVAALPGGHTSKRIPPSLFPSRGVDAIALLLAEGSDVASPWPRSRFARVVELRVARLPAIERDFEVAAVGRASPRYVILRHR